MPKTQVDALRDAYISQAPVPCPRCGRPTTALKMYRRQGTLLSLGAFPVAIHRK